MAKNAEVESSYSGRIRATKIFRTIICVLLCIISIFPFYLMIINSTLDSITIKAGVHLLPGSFAQLGENSPEPSILAASIISSERPVAIYCFIK